MTITHTLTPWPKIVYDIERYHFRACVGRILGADSLERLHDSGPAYALFTSAREDQQTAYHKRFYEGVSNFLALYGTFLACEILPLYSEPVYYQAVPTFRVHLPGNVAVAEEHRDRDYGHQQGEVNYWLPFTNAFDTNTVWIEDQAVEVRYGQVLVFDGVNLLHGNRPNATGQSRVSVDFRVIPASLYHDLDLTSVAAGRKFSVGSYWEGPLG